MPRFFFHLRGVLEDLDQDGVDLPDMEAAYLEAHQSALDMAQEWLHQGRNPRGYAFEVVNDTGEVVFELPFAEALDRQAGRRPVNLPGTIRTAKEQGERMMRLTAELAQQVKDAQANLRRSCELLQHLGKNRAG
ncbi:DUF6894 family protein [Microvirga arabica]|uniref:DUF6894 family protein n=1 Tax=Microvirga arabica TaxID=1128671 RepID=A0ABV6YB53_9HYPH